MLQASEGGRVYLGRSALETSLREAPVLGPSGSIPVPMAAISTERISRPAPVEVSDGPDVIEKGVLIARSTLAGLCLTAFACGIIATIAIGHGHAPTLQHQARVAETPPAPAPATAAASAAPAELPAAAPAAPDPLVVQLAGTAPAEPDQAVDKPAAAPHVVAARTPRPPVTRTPPVRRRPAPATVADAPASSAAAPAKWVDPFAE